MILIIGLGNPGRIYKNTPHNLGFEVLDLIKSKYNFPSFKDFKNSKISIKDNIILVKPQTFMNKSGIAVQELRDEYKIPIQDVWIIHDDIDLEFGKIRYKLNSSSGGHNGIKDIIDHCKSENFHRIKIGVKTGHIKDPKRFVLERFNRLEKKKMFEIKNSAVTEIATALPHELIAR